MLATSIAFSRTVETHNWVEVPMSARALCIAKMVMEMEIPRRGGGAHCTAILPSVSQVGHPTIPPSIPYPLVTTRTEI